MAAIPATFLLFILLIPLPNPLFPPVYSTILTAEDETLLSAQIAADEQWRFPPSDSIPFKFNKAILLFEDEYFHYHPGVNPISLFRAIWQNVEAGEIVSGGSTLTMQTMRMAYGNQSRSYAQKLVEILASIKLDLIYSKNEILKIYADHAPFGGNIVGINAASWRYYGRPPHLLSWAETATLAILPNSPASIFPGKNDDILISKRDFLLDKMNERGLISEDDLFLAKQEPLPSSLKPLPNKAYHLLHRSIRENSSETKIHSSLSPTLQTRALSIVKRYSSEMAKNQINNAAAIIIDIKSGETKAYIGNTDNPGDHGQHVDIITARRSPGSLLKPILYAASLDDGLITPTQLLPDIPLFYRGFAPKNFDKEYRGAVPANQALTSSLNVPFVHLLIEYGYEKFHHKLVQMGFKSFDKPAGHYGLSIILGGAETTLWEIANVYSGMARARMNFMNRPLNNGYSELDYASNTYLKVVKDSNEEIGIDGYLRVPSIDQTLKVLQEVKRPEEESGWEFFGSARPISWKTGTSYGFRDAWAIGLNNKYLIGVWIGNSDGEGRAGLTGIKAAAPLLFELFDLVDGDVVDNEGFGSEELICKESGMLASAICENKIPIQLADYMLKGPKCTYHQIVHLNSDMSHQVNSSCYRVSHMENISWFVLPPVQSWYYKKYHPSYKKLPPYKEGCSTSGDNKIFDLIYPTQFTKVYIPVEQDGFRGKAIFEAAHEDRNSILYWHLDDEFLGITTNTHQMAISADKGFHTVTIVDEAGNEITRKFEVIN
ncbi:MULTISPECIES: penicillin-binding protein 1C [unclassified Ekhidna]|uniref:penicillin-binding protein 1C n=1 Tax=unclassified Ekhidna TaxID=2632188 RepID=UPI0032DF55C5